MNAHQKKLIYSIIAVALTAAAYYIFVRITGLGIPCVFHAVTGLSCPGCGISRMLIALTKLDFAAAFTANAFLLITLPFIIFEIIFEFIRSFRGKKEPRLNEVLLIIYCVLLIIWGVFRNIIGI